MILETWRDTTLLWKNEQINKQAKFLFVAKSVKGYLKNVVVFIYLVCFISYWKN